MSNSPKNVDNPMGTKRWLKLQWIAQHRVINKERFYSRIVCGLTVLLFQLSAK